MRQTSTFPSMGSLVSLFAFGTVLCMDATAYANPLSDALPVGWVHVPGAVVRTDCIHKIPKGALVDPDSGTVTVGGQLYAQYPACPEPPVLTHGSSTAQLPSGGGIVPNTGGWVEDVENFVNLPSGYNINNEGGVWNVPPAPSHNEGQTIFFFNGLEPDGQNAILQPVLQWGPSEAGGGASWGIASWALFPNGTFISPLETVGQGDLIVGQTSFTQSGGTLNWTVSAVDATTGASSSQGVSTTGYKWDWAYGAVLEVYGVNQCPDLPVGNATKFSSMFISDTQVGNVTPNWSTRMCANTNTCNPGYAGPHCAFGFTKNQQTAYTLSY